MAQDKEKARARQKRYREAHPEVNKRWHAEHPESNREAVKRYAQTHPEVAQRYYSNHKEEHRQASLRYYYAHKDSCQVSSRRWRQENPDKVQAFREMRRAREFEAEGMFTGADIKVLYEAQDGLCAYCGIELRGFHIDHYMPLVLGGTSWPDNLRLSCSSCNHRKSDKAPEVWEAEIVRRGV